MLFDVDKATLRPAAGPILDTVATALDGMRVSDDAIATGRGPEHCGWQSVLLLEVGRPPGTTPVTPAGPRVFVRDPAGHEAFTASVAGRFDPDASLPADAASSGYRTQDVELWFAPSAPDSAFLTDGHDVESWPRATRTVGCA